jgi:phosphohistidine phosphatase SixA
MMIESIGKPDGTSGQNGTARQNATETVLIFMRHGARAFDGDALSPEGKNQAVSLGKTLLNQGLPLPNLIDSSPKKRTQATLATLASELGLHVQTDRRLDERAGAENERDFETRVKEYLNDCDTWAAGQADATTRLLCSHLDWLEAAVLFVASDENDFERSEPWPPLTIRAYTYEDGIWKRRKALS